MFASFNARALGLDLSAKATIDLAAEVGFDGVDLLVRDLLAAGEDVAGLRQRMQDLGLRGGAWPLPVQWRGDPDLFAADLRDLPRHTAVAVELGLTRTGTWVMPETPPDSRLTCAQTAAIHEERLGKIARILAEHECRLGLEIIGASSFRTGRGEPFVTRYGELLSMLGPLVTSTRNVGLLLDVFHLYAAGEDIAQALCGWDLDRIVWAHVADLSADGPTSRSSIQDHDRGLPGERGAIDVAHFLDQLQAWYYDGPVTVEPLKECRSLRGLSPREVALRAFSSLQKLWPLPAAPESSAAHTR